MNIDNINGSGVRIKDINRLEWFFAKTNDYFEHSLSNKNIGMDNFVEHKYKLDISNDKMDIPLMYIYKFHPYSLHFNNLIKLNREIGNSYIYLSMTDNGFRSLNPPTLHTAPTKSFMLNIFKNIKPDGSHSRYCLKDGVLFKDNFPVIIVCAYYDMAIDYEVISFKSFTVYIDKGFYMSKEKFDKVLVNLIDKNYLSQTNVDLSLKVCNFSSMILSLGKNTGNRILLPKIKPTRKNINKLLMAYPF